MFFLIISFLLEFVSEVFLTSGPDLFLCFAAVNGTSTSFTHCLHPTSRPFPTLHSSTCHSKNRAGVEGCSFSGFWYYFGLLLECFTNFNALKTHQFKLPSLWVPPPPSWIANLLWLVSSHMPDPAWLAAAVLTQFLYVKLYTDFLTLKSCYIHMNP